MKTIASLVYGFSTLTLLVVVGMACGCTSTVFYLRTPALDKAEVHTEHIGGSFAYKTTELLAYSPIVYNMPFPFTINYQHPLSVLLARPGIPTSAVPVDVDVTVELQSQLASEPESEVSATDEPIHDSAVTLDDDDTVAVDAATK